MTRLSTTLKHQRPGRNIRMGIPIAASGGLLLLGLSVGCAATYTAPDFDAYAGGHRTVAVLPFDVKIGSARERRGPDADDLAAEAARQSEAFQRALYARFLAGQQRGRYTVTFQDVDETNALLRGKNAVSKDEIAGVLGVDAVISGWMELTKPIGLGTAIVASILLGGDPIHGASIGLTIHDGESGSLLWTYDHAAEGGILDSPDKLARDLVRGVESRFPYRKR